MDILRLLPKNEYDASIGANAPSASNVFATIADIPAAATTLYNGNGSLSANRTVTMGANTLAFEGNQTTFKGFGTTSGTSALVVKNSANDDLLRIKDNSEITIGSVTGGGTQMTLNPTSSTWTYLAPNILNGLFTLEIGPSGWEFKNIIQSFTGCDFKVGRFVNFLIEDDSQFTMKIDPTTLTADRVATLQDASGTIAYLSDIPAANNLGVANQTLTANRIVALDAKNLSFDNGVNTLFHIDSINERIGIGTNNPQHGIQINTKDTFFNNSRVGIFAVPGNGNAKLSVSNDGTNGDTSALCLYPSYSTQSGTLMGGYVRIVSNRNAVAGTTFQGFRAWIQGTSSAGTHTNYGVYSKVETTKSGAANVTNIGGYFEAVNGTTNIALQVVDGTQGLNKVLRSDATGKASWVDPNTLITFPVTAVAQTYTPTNVTTDRAYDANSTSLDELADVVGTLIADLKTSGIIL